MNQIYSKKQKEIKMAESRYCNEDFYSLPRKTDPDFKDSIFDKMGHTDQLCPICGAHITKSDICLNGCHLAHQTLEKFNGMMGMIGTTSKGDDDE